MNKFYVDRWPRDMPAGFEQKEKEQWDRFRVWYAQQQGNEEGPGVGVIERPGTDQEQKLDHPKMWNVILLNDNYTPFWVVIEVIKTVFGFSSEEAERRMRSAHTTGRCHMGTFTKDIAEMKARQVSEETKRYGDFPLQADVEEAPSP